MNSEVFSVFFNGKPLNFTKSMSFQGRFPTMETPTADRRLITASDQLVATL